MIASATTVGSAALALALGLRHGLDADHLAAIDSMTRFNMIRRHACAPYCGALFSAGHGAAVVLAATALIWLASAWTPPAWLEPAGKSVSAAVLLLLGISNLLALIRDRRASGPGHLIGIRTRLFSFVLRSSGPWQIMLVGVLFAVSFDALGLAVLFAASAGTAGGALLASAVAAVFAVGLVIVGTANGAWLARLARRSDHVGNSPSHVMTLSIALTSLLVGAAMAASCIWSAFDRWLSAHELGAGLLSALVILCAYSLAIRRACGQRVVPEGRTGDPITALRG